MVSEADKNAVKLWAWSQAPEEYKALFQPVTGWQPAWILYAPPSHAQCNWPWNIETALFGGHPVSVVDGNMEQLKYPMRVEVFYLNNGLDTLAILLVEEDSPWIT